VAIVFSFMEEKKIKYSPTELEMYKHILRAGKTHRTKCFPAKGHSLLEKHTNNQKAM